MKVAVMTLCRDRLAYTQHCFLTLRDNAGCEFDHYVLDNGSQDGTEEWLLQELYAYRIKGMSRQMENIGCTRGWNTLLRTFDFSGYDVLVCFDNDCEVVTPDTLSVVAGLAAKHKVILSPRVDGLLYPPQAVRLTELDGHPVEETRILGNIFMAIPSALFFEHGFTWDERFQVWDGGESITQWYRDKGGWCGYVSDFRVNHYLTTLGQKAHMPWYAERRVAEGGRAQ